MVADSLEKLSDEQGMFHHYISYLKGICQNVFLKYASLIKDLPATFLLLVEVRGLPFLGSLLLTADLFGAQLQLGMKRFKTCISNAKHTNLSS